jgi:hypothetical protein
MRFLVLLSLVALLVFPAAGMACDRDPGNPGNTAAGLSITRSALAVVHIGAKPKPKPKHHAAKAKGYGY